MANVHERDNTRGVLAGWNEHVTPCLQSTSRRPWESVRAHPSAGRKESGGRRGTAEFVTDRDSLAPRLAPLRPGGIRCLP
jgi:hypothetical protein